MVQLPQGVRDMGRFFSLGRLLAMLAKESIQMRRDRITFAMMLGVPLIYLITTLIPSAMLTELGVRGSVAVAVLSPLGGEAALVLLATTCLWLINVAMPASAGSLILLVARIRIRNKGT